MKRAQFDTAAPSCRTGRISVGEPRPIDNARYDMYSPIMVSRLQAEIKQTKPFPRRSSEALLSVLRTAALLEHRYRNPPPYGITELQYNVLRILRGARPNGLCGREISERLVSQVPDVSRLLDRMESVQLLRERDDADRRHVTARITPKGLRVLDKTRPSSKSSRGSASATSTPSGCSRSSMGCRTSGRRCGTFRRIHLL